MLLACPLPLGLNGYDRFTRGSDIKNTAIDGLVVARWIDDPELILLDRRIVDGHTHEGHKSFLRSIAPNHIPVMLLFQGVLPLVHLVRIKSGAVANNDVRSALGDSLRSTEMLDVRQDTAATIVAAIQASQATVSRNRPARYRAPGTMSP